MQVKLNCLSYLLLPHGATCHAVLNRLTTWMTIDNAEPPFIFWTKDVATLIIGQCKSTHMVIPMKN